MKFSLVLLSLVTLSTITAAPTDSHFDISRDPGPRAGPFQPCNPEFGWDSCFRPSFECVEEDGDYKCLPRQLKQDHSTIKLDSAHSRLDSLGRALPPFARPYEPCDPGLGEVSCMRPFQCVVAGGGTMCLPPRRFIKKLLFGY